MVNLNNVKRTLGNCLEAESPIFKRDLPKSVAQSISDKTLKLASAAAAAVGIAGMKVSLPQPELSEPVLPEKINSLEDIFIIENISDEEADSILKNFGLSDVEISKLRSQTNDLNLIVNALNVISKYTKDDDESNINNMSAPEVVESIEDIILYNQIDSAKYFNDYNIKFIKKYFCTEIDNPLEILNELAQANSESKETFNRQLAIASDIFYLAGGSFKYSFQMLRDFVDDDELDLFTPDRIAAQGKIDKILGEEVFSFYDCANMENPSNVTDDFLNFFEKQVKRAKNLGIQVRYDEDVVDFAPKLKELSDKCEKAELNFSWGNPIPINQLESILMQKNLKPAKQFMDSCSIECKKKFEFQIHNLMAYSGLEENLELYTEFYNFIAGLKLEFLPDALLNPANFIMTLKRENVTDFKGVRKLLTAFDEVGVWPNVNEPENYVIKDNDYESATKFIYEVASLPQEDSGGKHSFAEYITSYRNWGKNLDFKVLLERLQTAKKLLPEEVLKASDLNWLCLSKNPECVEIYKTLCDYGVAASCSSYFLFMEEDFTAKQLQEKLDIMLHDICKHLPEDLKNIDDKCLFKILCTDSMDFAYMLGNMIKQNALSLDEIGAYYRTNNNSKGAAGQIVKNFKPETKDFMLDIIKRRQDLNLNVSTCWDGLRSVNTENIKLARILFEDKDFPRSHISLVLNHVDKDTVYFAKKLYDAPDFDNKHIGNIMYYTKKDNVHVVEKLLSRKDLSPQDYIEILNNLYNGNLSLADKILDISSFDKELIRLFLASSNSRNSAIAEKLLFEYKLPEDQAYQYFKCVLPVNIPLSEKLFEEKKFPVDLICQIIKQTNSEELAVYADKLCTDYERMELDISKIPFLIENYGRVDVQMLKKFVKGVGNDTASKLSNSDLAIACRMVDMLYKQNINEIPVAGKKELLRSLVACNEGLFYISPLMKELFPMIPTDRVSYCSLLPAIVRSMGIETNILDKNKTNSFNHSVNTLAENLAKLSDSDFVALDITQEYSREQFIEAVLDKVSGLNPAERQKVYDYFGFELHESKVNSTGYTIAGYPVNLNNGKKLSQIMNPETKSVIEALRHDVIKFSEQNRIICNNASIESLLNDIVDVLPEIRSQIGKTQHDTHSYDVFKHSLKVMQKIAQQPNFKRLNKSDKKVMLLAALLHDITKIEGVIDKTHAAEGSFDAFFIAKKFDLTKDEEIKLFTLIRQHEWLVYVNTAKSERELTKRLQSVAYDLRQDNLFDMALIFTHADLKAVKYDNSFHDTTEGASRAKFQNGTRVFDRIGGTPISHGDVAELYAERIREYVDELKISQPILPVTRFPSASTINNAITEVNSDGTTNIKGVYKDSDGLIIVKYNEVEDWQIIGFPDGVSSHGIMAKGVNLKGEECDVETGNIKFFAHGLDYVNQLAKFDAFGLIDSDVLLSVSYAERPESKFRFFRPQGVILDVDTKYIHGGGNTDSGSGCGKFLKEFKNNYIFGGGRESDRLYVSNLIKNATGMTDDEYIAFVKANENKPMHRIEPAEVREKIIQAFATINSNVRRGNREYNEMYITNPDVMGVFAYPMSGKVGNAASFINSEISRLKFLKEHALERDLPFVVFGD